MHTLKSAIFLSASLFVLSCFAFPAFSQQHYPKTGNVDSIGVPPAKSPADSAAQTKQDSTHKLTHADSLRMAADTLERMSTPPLVGALDRNLDSAHYVTKEDINWIDYQSLGNILELFPGVYVRDLSSTGQYNQINIRGADWRSIAVLQNGRLMNDPVSGIYNLYQYSTEYADRVELITGPRAFLYGLNSSAGAVNIVTRNYNSNRPFTKLNYDQGAYGYAKTDGTFSQNLSRKFNLTFGFQFQGVDGRFTNSLDEVWNGRVKIRYNFSKDLNVIFSDYFTSSKTDLNGGINVSASNSTGQSPFAANATVKNAESYEKITRHDADLAVVGTFLKDSSNVTMLDVYYSTNLREYRDEENRLGLTNGTNGIFTMSDHRSSWMGANFTQNFDTDFQRFSMGLNAELRHVDGSPNVDVRKNTIASVWGKEEFLLGQFLTVAGFGRIDDYLQKNYAGAGADATLHLGPSIDLFGGLSLSSRAPNYMELYWTDSTVARGQAPVAEKHRQVELGAEFRGTNGSSLRVAYFYESVADPIRFLPLTSSYVFPAFTVANGASIATNGIEARLRLHLWVLYLEGSGTYLIQTEGGSTLSDLPKLSLNGGIYVWSKFLQDHLDIKSGFRGKYRSGQSGELFNPEALAFVSNTGTRIGYASSVDFFLIAHVGDAYVHLMWENLLDVQYYATPFYPGGDRAVRLGISWNFWN